MDDRRAPEAADPWDGVAAVDTNTEPGRLRRVWNRIRSAFTGERAEAVLPNPWLTAGPQADAADSAKGAADGVPGAVAATTAVPASGTAGAAMPYDPDSPGVTPDDPGVRGIIHATNTNWVEHEFVRAVNELHGRNSHDRRTRANFTGMDLLSAKESAIILLYGEMILPSTGHLEFTLGTPKSFPSETVGAYTFQLHDGTTTMLNPVYFAEGRRNTLLNALQEAHDQRILLGGGHYGAVPFLLHEKMHAALFDAEPPAAQDANRPDKSAFKAADPRASSGTVNHPSAVGWANASENAGSKALHGVWKTGKTADLRVTNTPHALEPIGGYGRKNPAERWAEGGRLVAGYGSAAPEEAKRIWEYAVPMDAERWAALDRQVANLYRTLDTLYEQTDPGTGLRLTHETDRKFRAFAITASKGFAAASVRGRAPRLDGVVHGVNSVSQKERDAMTVLPTWAAHGRGQSDVQVDII